MNDSDMQIVTVLLAVVIFLILIWVLVAILLFARKKLVPEGKAKIKINQEKEIETDYGCTLLQALTNENILMPSGCGGGGTCGTCKGIVRSGGGSLLPTETVHINRKMAQDQYRLFCQVKVKNEMEIEVPQEIFSARKWNCEVVSNRNVATFIKELVVKLPEGETID
ncbi:MAG: 2Fe-2S iron-sulfur cluster-binding protein, partial [Bacteroidales bacterium]